MRCEAEKSVKEIGLWSHSKVKEEQIDILDVGIGIGLEHKDLETASETQELQDDVTHGLMHPR